ncbi:MAG: exonuclease SbcCD subunit D C-terminal domain-containing protein [Bacteroidota bacterium]
MFKLLHTADWHLGQRFLHRDRLEEQTRTLDWLLDQVKVWAPDAFVLAGDVFDVSNPSNAAMTLYYRFLTSLRKTDCRHIIVVGGNHDSPSRLNAPYALLKSMDVHVIGHAEQGLNKQIIPLHHESGKLEAVVAAVPFLRDQDLRYTNLEATETDRLASIRNGIKAHYQQLAESIQEQYGNLEVPCITTGHLYVKGGSRAGDKIDRIHMGSIDSIDAETFPNVFDYVALGHLHRPQMVDHQLPHIRYSGSLIPLSFSEITDQKSVALIHFEANTSPTIQLEPVPVARRLIRISGEFETVQQKLQDLTIEDDQLPAWVECIVETDQIIPDLDGQLRSLTKDRPFEILKLRSTETIQGLDELISQKELEELSVWDVFEERLKLVDGTPEQLDTYRQSFGALLDWIEQEDNL